MLGQMRRKVRGIMLNNDLPSYCDQFDGRFENLLRWPMLDELWESLRSIADDGWYIYAVGETPPEEPVTSQQLLDFIAQMDSLLRKDHDEEFCGIVYTDDRKSPKMVKIFDPNNLGSSCGSCGFRVLPGWIISRQKPENLQDAVFPVAANRRRWWQRIFK